MPSTCLTERRKDWPRILTVVDRPVDIGVGGHPHKGEVSEVDLRKSQDQGIVVVLQVLARVGHQHNQVVGIFVRIRIVRSEHRAPEFPILSAIFRELDDERRPIGSLHHLPILLEETRWDVAGGEEQVERSKGEDSDVDHVRDEVAEHCIVKSISSKLEN